MVCVGASSITQNALPLEGFSEAVSYELASQNIVVKLIEPHGGVTATNFNVRVAEDSGDIRAVADYDQFKARHIVARLRLQALALAMLRWKSTRPRPMEVGACGISSASIAAVS